MDRDEPRHLIRQELGGPVTSTRGALASLEIRRGSDGVTLAERISALVKIRQPYAYCIPCLAGVLRAPEKLVRDSAQFALVRDGLRIEQRTCRECNCTDDALTLQ